MVLLIVVVRTVHTSVHEDTFMLHHWSIPDINYCFRTLRHSTAATIAQQNGVNSKTLVMLKLQTDLAMLSSLVQQARHKLSEQHNDVYTLAHW